jgi:hypothetical protein
MYKYFLCLLIACQVCGIATAQVTRNVFIVVIDGARYSETFGDSLHRYVPVMWNQLRPLGTLYTSFYNDGVTKTIPGHTSILTGTWQTIVNNGSERPNMPTLFEYYRKQKNTLITSSYVVLGKDKLNVLTYSTHEKYGPDYRASVKRSTKDSDDCRTFENIKEVMSESHPHLLIANFGGVDIAGHDEEFINYTSKIKIADSLIGVLWSYIQSDSAYMNRTTLIITNDHGRHLDSIAGGFHKHGDGCEGCRHISLLVLGPDTPAGVTDTTARKQIDIAPTVGRLLGFETTYSVGGVINTAISNDAGRKDFNIKE